MAGTNRHSPEDATGTVISKKPLTEVPTLPDEKQEDAVKVFPGATFECVRCGTRFSGKSPSASPETTCSNCGYRIFRKVRGPAAKTLKAE